MEFPKFSYKNILHACAFASSVLTTKEVMCNKCGEESLAVLPAFTAFSISSLKFAYDNGFNSKAFVFGVTTTMAYTISDIVKGCGYFAQYSRHKGVNGVMLGLTVGMAVSVVFGGICHGAYMLAERLDKNQKTQSR